MAEVPKLPLEVQAQIELARETLRNVAKVKWPMVFGLTFPVTSLVPAPPKDRRPANLKLQLQDYASARFDLEAQHYPQHAKDKLELRAWLALLATRVSLEIFQETDEYTSFHDFHCPFSERQDAIYDALTERSDHWFQVAKNQYELSVLSGKLEPLLARVLSTSKPEPPINPTAATAQEIGTEISSREARLQKFILTEKTTIASVSRAANVYKANMQQWRRGELSDDSAMSMRIEAVLSGETPLQPRGKKKGKNKE
jgi:hypothetical protein